jgi:hypothetical protein
VTQVTPVRERERERGRESVSGKDGRCIGCRDPDVERMAIRIFSVHASRPCLPAPSFLPAADNDDLA